MSLFGRATFLPSLAYNLIRNRWSEWNWFDRIDDQVCLGALPFHGPVTYQLYHSEHIRSVVSMNENFELIFTVTNCYEWKSLNVEYLQLNTADIFHAPTLSQLILGVKFILDQQNRNYSHKNNCLDQLAANRKRIFYDNNPLLIHWPIRNNGRILKIDNESRFSMRELTENHYLPSTYVHCKAGRTRSATLVACYLMKKYNLTPKESIHELQKGRKQILLRKKQWQALESFHEHHLLCCNEC